MTVIKIDENESTGDVVRNIGQALLYLSNEARALALTANVAGLDDLALDISRVTAKAFKTAGSAAGTEVN